MVHNVAAPASLPNPKGGYHSDYPAQAVLRPAYSEEMCTLMQLVLGKSITDWRLGDFDTCPYLRSGPASKLLAPEEATRASILAQCAVQEQPGQLSASVACMMAAQLRTSGDTKFQGLHRKVAAICIKAKAFIWKQFRSHTCKGVIDRSVSTPFILLCHTLLLLQGVWRM